jgi:hypothetical protein
LTVTLPLASTLTLAVADADAEEDALAEELEVACADALGDAVAEELAVVFEEDCEPHALRPSAPARAMDRMAAVFFAAGVIAIVFS